MNFKNLSLWEVLPFTLLIIFCAPIFIVLSSLFGEYSDNWIHLYNYVLVDYISSTFFLISGVSVLVFFIGTITAWIVTNYDFIRFSMIFRDFIRFSMLFIDFCQVERPSTRSLPDTRSLSDTGFLFNSRRRPGLYLALRPARRELTL